MAFPFRIDFLTSFPPDREPILQAESGQQVFVDGIVLLHGRGQVDLAVAAVRDMHGDQRTEVFACS